VAAITLIGILLLPFIFILIFVACVLGYLAGIYFLGLRIGSAITPMATNGKRIVMFAIALIVVGLLGLIPLLGWLIGVVLLLFGLGTMAVAQMTSWSERGSNGTSGVSAGPMPAAT
jgi:hypothetical protein